MVTVLDVENVYRGWLLYWMLRTCIGVVSALDVDNVYKGWLLHWMLRTCIRDDYCTGC